jgi:glycosyltransferase involved in cell wall biosynthesis
MSEGDMRKLNVMALGLRGVPNVPGGIEAHAAELYPRLQALGVNVTVLGRIPYRPLDAPLQWHGVNLLWLPAPRIQGVEALLHTLVGVLYAAVHRPDVLHIHAIGPWLWVPLAKACGLKVLVTHHGQDYLREKWSTPARALLRLGERFGVRLADECIVISHEIRESVQVKFGRASMLIPNGVGDLQRAAEHALVRSYGLTPQHYVIQVSRLVPEKRQHDLIAAFNEARLAGWKLVLVGGAQGSQRYAERLRKQYENNNAIICTGFLSPPEVQQLLSHAGIFALPSSHEGLPIALLEAMKMGIPVLASDIPANLEVGLDAASYFPLGDTKALSARLCSLAAATTAEREVIANQLAVFCGKYNWDTIAKSTLQIIEEVGRKGSTAVSVNRAKPIRPLGANGSPPERRPVMGKLLKSFFSIKPETSISVPASRSQPILARRQWISNPWHAVGIVPCMGACQAARIASSTRYLSAEAPRLPLADCVMRSCTCHYRHYQDRRKSQRRVSDLVASTANWAGRERSAAQGRRSTD